MTAERKFPPLVEKSVIQINDACISLRCPELPGEEMLSVNPAVPSLLRIICWVAAGEWREEARRRSEHAYRLAMSGEYRGAREENEDAAEAERNAAAWEALK